MHSPIVTPDLQLHPNLECVVGQYASFPTNLQGFLSQTGLGSLVASTGAVRKMLRDPGLADPLPFPEALNTYISTLEANGIGSVPQLFEVWFLYGARDWFPDFIQVVPQYGSFDNRLFDLWTRAGTSLSSQIYIYSSCSLFHSQSQC